MGYVCRAIKGNLGWTWGLHRVTGSGIPLLWGKLPHWQGGTSLS